MQAEIFPPFLVLREALAIEKPTLATFENSWTVFHSVVAQYKASALNISWLTSGDKAKQAAY